MSAVTAQYELRPEYTDPAPQAKITLEIILSRYEMVPT